MLVVDGAAFGSEMKDVSEYLSVDSNLVLYAPESFEWLILNTNVIPNINNAQILLQPEKYIDSKEFASWEQYFTRLLTDITKESIVWRYSKKKLPKAYLSAKVINTAKKFMKLIVWD